MREKVVILLGALVLCASGCASSGTAGGSSATGSRDANLITTAEIDATNQRDAYELVQRLRPNWIARDATATSRAGGAGGVIVYLGNSKQGWLTSLHDIPATQVGSMQWLDPSTATAVLPGLGQDFIAGAIVVHLRSGR